AHDVAFVSCKKNPCELPTFLMSVTTPLTVTFEPSEACVGDAGSRTAMMDFDAPPVPAPPSPPAPPPPAAPEGDEAPCAHAASSTSAVGRPLDTQGFQSARASTSAP